MTLFLRTFSALILLLWCVAAAQADKMQTITIGLQLEPPHLDPTSAAAGAIDQVLYANVYEGLTRFTSKGEVAPALAKSWAISDDGLRYVFTLNDGVTFHNGDRMTAEDVKFSLDRARDDGSTNAQKKLYSGISTIEVIDDHTVAITLDAANGLFLFNLAWGDAIIVNRHSADTLTSNANGTGPFMVKEWRRGDRIILVKNPNYWGTPAQIDRATFRFIADPSAGFAAMMAGDIDGFPGYPAPETLPQFEADGRFLVTTGSTEGETILAFNHQNPSLADRRVRKAISHAIDRKAVIDGAMFGYGIPIGTHFAPHHPDYLDLTAQSAYDPDLARKLLAEAGYSKGLSLTLKLPPPSYARRSGEIIAAELQEVGITAEIITLEWAQWLEQVFRQKDYDLTIISHTEPFDIGIYGRQDYYFGYENAEFQRLINILETESDAARRRQLSQQAQRIISDDYVNAYLFQLPQITVINKNLKGLWVNAPTQAADLTHVYWQD